MARLVLSAFIGIAPEHKLRVIAPDVGGGFGSKIFIYAEETVCIWAAKKVGRPVKWTADRTEAFLSDAHGRDHVTHAELAIDADGKILGLRVKTTANLGAYLSTFSSSVPTYLYAPLLSGQYDIPAIYCEVDGGLHQHRAGRRLSRRRPAGGDLRGRAAGRGRGARARHGSGRVPPQNFIKKFPYQTPVIMMYDTGDYDASLDKALEIDRLQGLRQAQARQRPQRQAARHRLLLLYRGLRHRALGRRSARSAPASACGNRPRSASTRPARSRC